MKKRSSNSISIDGKVAVISGAASGIGLETAKLLANENAKIALIDIDESSGEKAAKDISRQGGEALFFRCDVTSNSDCKRTVNNIHDKFGRIDILFNNAGVIRRKNIIELDEEEWDLVLGVNLKAIFLLSRYVLPIMIENRAGIIINNGSGWGLKGGPKAAAYCAAKGGVVNLTRAMAIDFGQYGIRVNCICPGDINTNLLKQEAIQLGIDEKEFLLSCAERPIGRIGKPQDVANAVLYLSSDLSSWITGITLVVDGGGLA
jgi:NAD(P)-dependent dehydrogenase (short-subunit alcohol dehydrogenase family)